MHNITQKLKNFILSRNYRSRIHIGLGFYDNLDDKSYLKKLFMLSMHRELDLSNPVTFNEKLQWLKLYDRRPEYTMMVDKYLVRDYIANKLGEEYLIPLLGVWDDPDDIDFDSLPDRFVLKCNHNSGLGMCICKDKSTLNIKKVKADLRKGIKQDYYLTGREWPYKNVPRKIIAEKYMEDNSFHELRDYKFFCFNGEPKFTLVCTDRFSVSGLKEDFYDLEWNHMAMSRLNHGNASVEIQKPKNYELMCDFARQLAKDIPFVRCDFYEINGRLYFGELTFFPASGFEGFEPENWDKKLGDWITLPNN